MQGLALFCSFTEEKFVHNYEQDEKAWEAHPAYVPIEVKTRQREESAERTGQLLRCFDFLKEGGDWTYWISDQGIGSAIVKMLVSNERARLTRSMSTMHQENV